MNFNLKSACTALLNLLKALWLLFLWGVAIAVVVQQVILWVAIYGLYEAAGVGLLDEIDPARACQCQPVVTGEPLEFAPLVQDTSQPFSFPDVTEEPIEKSAEDLNELFKPKRRKR